MNGSKQKNYKFRHLASSVTSESLFSEIGVIDSNCRRRLLADRIEMLTFNVLSLTSDSFK